MRKSDTCPSQGPASCVPGQFVPRNRPENNPTDQLSQTKTVAEILNDRVASHGVPKVPIFVPKLAGRKSSVETLPEEHQNGEFVPQMPP